MTRQQPRTFVLTLEARPGSDAIRALRGALKVLLRRHQLRCTDIREELAELGGKPPKGECHDYHVR